MRGFPLHCGPAASMISLTAFLVGCEAQHAGAPTSQQTEQTASPSAPEFITAESEKVMSLRRQQVVTLTTLAGISLQQRLMRNGHSPRTVVRAGERPAATRTSSGSRRTSTRTQTCSPNRRGCSSSSKRQTFRC